MAKPNRPQWETIQEVHTRLPTGSTLRRSTGSAKKGPRGAATNFGGARFWPIPFGRIIAKASRDTEEILIAQCDPRLQEETRRNWPFLRDRRIDAYAPITQRYLDQKLRL